MSEGDITPRARRRIRGLAHLLPAHAPMLRPFARSTGRPGADGFIRPGHTGISAVIPAGPVCKAPLAARPPAAWKEGGLFPLPAALWREQPVSLRHLYVEEIACGSAVPVFRIPDGCYFIDVRARLEGESASIESRLFAACGRLPPIFIAPAFHAYNGIGFLCKSQRAVASGVSYGGDNSSSQCKGCALPAFILTEFPSASFFCHE